MNRLLHNTLFILIWIPFAAVCHSAFDGLNMNMGNLSRISDAETRSISPENFTGAKGKGAMADPHMKGDKRNVANAALQAELNDQINRAQDAEQDLEESRQIIIELEEQAKQAQLDSKEEKERLIADYDLKIAEVQDKAAKEFEQTEDQAEQRISQIQNQAEQMEAELREQVKDLQAQHQGQIEQIQSQAEERIAAVESSAAKTKAQLEEKNNALQKKHKDEIKSLDKEHQQLVNKLQTEAEFRQSSNHNPR